MRPRRSRTIARARPQARRSPTARQSVRSDKWLSFCTSGQVWKHGHYNRNSKLLAGWGPEVIEHNVHDDARHRNIEPNWKHPFCQLNVLLTIECRRRHLLRLRHFATATANGPKAEVHLAECKKRYG